MNDFVDFEFNEEDIAASSVMSLKDNTDNDKKDKYVDKYSDQTTLYYVSIRKTKMDPITFDTHETYFFKFKKMWDPYTGEIKEDDPHGPLYFNPCNLVKLFYVNRLNGLWKNSYRDNLGVYQGHYGDSVGAGENIDIKGRGPHPERYLFRLPLCDCYLSDDHNNNIVTMGPKLTKDDITEINSLAEKLDKTQYSYESMFKAKRPDLLKLYLSYTKAISNKVTYNDNCDAVELLKKM